jgi:hypothetical protein
MRAGLVLALLVAIAVPLADAQGAPPDGASPCGGGGGFRGGGGGGFGGSNRSGDRTGNFTRPDNFTRANDSIDGLNVTLDPQPPVPLAPGQSALVTLTMRNDGNATLDLALSAPQFGRSNATPPVTATVTPTEGSLAPGDSGTATVALTASSGAPTGCVASVLVLLRDAAENRTMAVRIAALLQAPGASAAAASTVPTAQTPTAQGKASPSTQVVGATLALCGAALLLRRR